MVSGNQRTPHIFWKSALPLPFKQYLVKNVFMRKLREIDVEPAPPRTGRRKKFPGKPHTAPAPIMRGNREAWEIVCNNLALIKVGAARHGLYKRVPRHLHEDVKSITLHSLFYSAQRWDPEKGKFSTYAISDMRRCIIQVDKLRGDVHVRTPLRRKITDILAFAKNNSISREEAMQSLGVSPKAQQPIYSAMQAVIWEKHNSEGIQLFYSSHPDLPEMQEFNMGLQETPSADSGINLGPPQGKELSRKEIARVVRKALLMLPTMHKKVLEMHFGFNGHDVHNLEQIGRIYSRSRERIRQLKAEALGMLLESSYGPRLKELMESLE